MGDNVAPARSMSMSHCVHIVTRFVAQSAGRGSSAGSRRIEAGASGGRVFMGDSKVGRHSPSSARLQRFMPNRYQVAFVASFVGTLLLLVLLTEFVKAKLHQRGVYVSDLILLGTGKKPSRHPVPPSDTMSELFNSSSSQLVALAFALLTSVFLAVKFGRGSEYFRSCCAFQCSPTSKT